jgi:hypothetical protein
MFRKFLFIILGTSLCLFGYTSEMIEEGIGRIFNGPVTVTGTTQRINGTDSYIDFDDGGSGTITLGSYDNTNNENIVIDIEKTANIATIRSTTGVTDILPAQNSKGTQLASFFLDVLTAPKLLTVFDSKTPNVSQPDYSGNINTATATGIDVADQTYLASMPVMKNFTGGEYYTIADSDTLSFGNSSADTAMSIGIMVNIQDAAGYRQVLGKEDYASGALAKEWGVGIDGNEKIKFSVHDNSTTSQYYIISSSGLAVGWHFVVFTYDGTGGATPLTGTNGVIYVDGLAVSDAVANVGGTYTAMENLTTTVNYFSYRDGASTVTNWTSNNGLGFCFISAEELTAVNVWKMWVRVKADYNL